MKAILRMYVRQVRELPNPALKARTQGFPQVLRTWGALQNLMGGT